MENIWQYFEWKAPEIGELSTILQSRLTRLIEPLEAVTDLPDADERVRNRAWARFLAVTLRDWAAALDIDPVKLPNFERAAYYKGVGSWQGFPTSVAGIGRTISYLLCSGRCYQ